MSQKLMEVGLGLNLDNVASVIHGAEIPGLSGGLPDDISKGSLYINTVDGSIWKKVSDGSGTDKWAEIPSLTAPKGLNNFSGTQVLDYFLVDAYNAAKWIVEITLSSDKSVRYVAEITAAHDGTPTSDATNVDYNQFGILQLGPSITGLLIACTLSGTGGSQVVNLTVGASQNIDVITRRLSFGENVGQSTPLDLTTVPHDVSGTILGTISANEPILFFTPSRSFSIPANFTNSKAVAGVAGSGETVFSIYKSSPPYSSDTLIGTVTFSSGSKSGVFSSSTATSLQSGDVLKVVSASPDASLANLCVTIQANYI